MVLQVIWGIKILASATASAAALSSLSMRPKSRKSDEKAGGRWRKSWWLVCFFCCGAAKNPTKNTWGEKFTVGKLFIFNVFFRWVLRESTFHLLLSMSVMQSLRMNINHQPNINPTQPGSHCQGHVLHQHVRVLENADPAWKNPPEFVFGAAFPLVVFNFTPKKLVHLLNVFCWLLKPTYPPALYIFSEMMNRLDGSSREGRKHPCLVVLYFITLMFSSTTSSSKNRLYIIHSVNPLLINQSFICFC